MCMNATTNHNVHERHMKAETYKSKKRNVKETESQSLKILFWSSFTKKPAVQFKTRIISPENLIIFRDSRPKGMTKLEKDFQKKTIVAFTNSKVFISDFYGYD